MKQLRLLAMAVVLVGCGDFKEGFEKGFERGKKRALENQKKETEESNATQERKQMTPFEETLQKAQKGDLNAIQQLASLYSLGNGVDKDPEEAFKWYHKAAIQGEFGAQFNIGWAYYRGEGIKKDDVNAYVWLSLAVTNSPNNTFFKGTKDRISAKLTPDQIAKAKALLKEMIEKNPKLLK